MEIRHIDHVNFRYPEGELDAALAFYRDKLGFETELLGEDDDGNPTVPRSHFSFRLGDECIIHMTPSDDPEVHNRYTDEARTAFDHVSLVVDEDIEEVKRRLAEQGIEIEREFEPDGATGTGPAVFVLDPFGYMLEIKESPERKRTRNEMIQTLAADGFGDADIAEAFGVSEAAVERICNPPPGHPG